MGFWQVFFLFLGNKLIDQCGLQSWRNSICTKHVWWISWPGCVFFGIPSLRVIHLLGCAFVKTQRCRTRTGLLFDGWVYFESLFFRLGFTKKSHTEANVPNPRPHYENLSSALYRPPNVIKTSGLRSLLALSLTHVYVLDTASADIFWGSSFSVLRKFSDLQMQYSKRKLEKTLFSVVLNRVKKYKES